MKGEADHQLEWPFHGRSKVQLLNQDKEEGKAHEAVLSFSDNNAASRVEIGDKAEHGYSFRIFISHNDLQPKYLKNDSLKFCINTE